MLSWYFEDLALQYINSASTSDYICGIDEVGRGSLAGPVVACAAIFKTRDLDFLDKINDSKKLSKIQRETLLHKLLANTFYAIGLSSNIEIDKMNIYNASFLAMKRAYLKLCKYCEPKYALIDGNKVLDIPIKCSAIIKGDGKSFSIAAASILAKVFRDNLMVNLSKIDNNYCYKWDKNAGYATKEHKQAIKNFGISKYHRKSFAPIKFLI